MMDGPGKFSIAVCRYRFASFENFYLEAPFGKPRPTIPLRTDKCGLADVPL